MKNYGSICAIGDNGRHPKGCDIGAGAIIKNSDGNIVAYCHICDTGRGKDWPKDPPHLDLYLPSKKECRDWSHHHQWYCVKCSKWPVRISSSILKGK